MSQPLIYPCPRCGTPYTLTPEYLAQYGGQTTVCANCGGQFVLPGAAMAPAHTPAAQASTPAQQGREGQPVAAQPQPVLPYAGPQWSMQGAAGAWSEGRVIIAAKGTSIAHACVKCGEPPAGRPFRRTFRWHQPLVYLALLVNILVYVVLALCLQEKAVVEYALCERHRRRRRNHIIGGTLVTLAGIGCFIMAALQEEVAWLPFGFLGFIGGLIWALLASQSLRPQKIDARFAWLKGAGEAFLRTLPPIQGPAAGYYPAAQYPTAAYPAAVPQQQAQR